MPRQFGTDDRHLEPSLGHSAIIARYTAISGRFAKSVLYGSSAGNVEKAVFIPKNVAASRKGKKDTGRKKLENGRGKMNVKMDIPIKFCDPKITWRIWHYLIVSYYFRKGKLNYLS